MADFNKAFENTMTFEGGYSYDPHDFGGETYRGISRRHFPEWEGWGAVDYWKTKNDWETAFHKLDYLVRSFYRARFWIPLRLDECTSETIAIEVFDTAVNLGRARAAVFLQEALNVMNRNGQLFPDLKVDGYIGPNTLSAINKLTPEDQEIVAVWINVQRGAHYMKVMREFPDQERFARGWAKRIRIDRRKSI